MTQTRLAKSRPGISWLEQLPDHWPIRRLSAAARPGYKTFTDGDWIELPYITDEGVRLVQTGNIGVGRYIEQGFRYISHETFTAFGCTPVHPGNILISRLADPVGRACIAPDLGGPAITSVDVAILQPSEAVDPRFLVYWLSSRPYLEYVRSISRGGTRDRVSRSQLGAVPVPIPPRRDQEVIADYLDAETSRADDLLARKRELVELIRERQAAMIAEAVLGGPPVPGRGAGHEQGHFPGHWRLIPFRRLFREVDERSATGAELLLSVSQTRGVIPQSDLGDRRQYAETLVGYKRCEPGDLVVNRMWVYYGALGVSSVAGVVSPDYSVFRTKPEANIDARFVATVLRTAAYVGEMTRLVRGIGAAFQGTVRKPRLHPRDLGQIVMPVPPLNEARASVSRISQITSQTDDLAAAQQRHIDLLVERRSTLITAAVLGELDISAEAA